MSLQECMTEFVYGTNNIFTPPMNDVWEPGFRGGGNRGKYWKLGFRVGKVEKILETRVFGGGKWWK